MKRKTLTSEQIDALAKKGIDKQKLTEENVQRIFKNCLATDETPESDIIRVYLMLNEFGFEKDGPDMEFDKKKIEEYRKGIKYMLGQLKVVHDDKTLIILELAEFMKKYGDYGYWTDSLTPVTELFYLSDAAGFGTWFELHKDKKIYTSLDSDIVPTFDPDDKNR